MEDNVAFLIISICIMNVWLIKALMVNTHCSRWSESFCNIYGDIDQACSVRMAEYWPSSFCACLWTESRSTSTQKKKKERGQYPAILTEQAWSTSFSCGTQRVKENFKLLFAKKVKNKSESEE